VAAPALGSLTLEICTCDICALHMSDRSRPKDCHHRGIWNCTPFGPGLCNRGSAGGSTDRLCSSSLLATLPSCPMHGLLVMTSAMRSGNRKSMYRNRWERHLVRAAMRLLVRLGSMELPRSDSRRRAGVGGILLLAVGWVSCRSTKRNSGPFRPDTTKYIDKLEFNVLTTKGSLNHWLYISIRVPDCPN